MALNSLPFMHQVITANRFQVRVRKKRESITCLPAKIAGLFRTVDADRDRTNADGVELIKILLNAPQLGVASWSPIASIEDQQHALRWFRVDRL